ncbi:MAG: hypothetical protein LBR10_12685 [Prevotellaceae bacterium]|jgi:hypothetical protein|nr:hypothetical protein [Prevotellaceae bacterium]
MNKIFTIIGVLLFFSCNRHSEPELHISNRTVIVYMLGDNSLNTEITPDINELEQSWSDEYDGNLVAYIDQKRVMPYVLKIENDRTSDVVSQKTITYSEQNSCTIEVMEKVISDIKKMYPAKSYGLILWSHASGWLPAANASTRAFGEDDGENMEIYELAKLSGKYDFIIFDACYMAGIETVFELKDNTDYIVASEAEILSYGFPYNKIISHLFKPDADLVSAAEQFMSFYTSSANEEMQSAVISVIDTRNLDALAAVSKTIIRKYKNNIAGLDLSNIQNYDYDEHIFFDFKDFMDNLAANDPDLQLFHNTLSASVVFENHTPSFMNKYNINRACGLNCYILGQYPGLDYAYQKLSWYKTVY